MDLLEVKKLYEDNVRVMTKNLYEILNLQIERVLGNDDALQDHLVGIKGGMCYVNEGLTIDECLDFIERFNQGMNDIKHQINWDDDHYSYQNWDASVIGHLLNGCINGRLTEELADCAIKVNDLANTLLNNASHKRTDKEFKRLLNRFINGVIVYAKEASIYVDEEMPFLYLQFWFKGKYYGEN